MNGRNVFLATLEAGSLRAGCYQDRLLVRAPSWLQAATSHCPHTVEIKNGRELSPDSYEDTNPIVRPHPLTSSMPNHLPKAHLLTPPPLGVRILICEFWGVHKHQRLQCPYRVASD